METIRKWFQSMNRNTIIVLLCAIIFVIALVIGVSLRKIDNSSVGEKNTAQHATAEDYQDVGDSNLKSISTNQKGKEDAWSKMTDSEYNLSMEVVEGGYTGAFVEDGTNDEVKNVLAIKFTNDGNKPVQYAEYVFGINSEPVSFKVTNLLPGESCLVQEMNRRKYRKNDVLELSTRVVINVDELPSAQEQVLVIDNSDDTLTLMNLTNQEIQNIKVFYKNYDKSLGCYLGGVTYSGTVESIVAGESITVAPEHFVSGSSVIMGSEILKS